MKRLLLLSIVALGLTASAAEVSRATVARAQSTNSTPVKVEKTTASNVVLSAEKASDEVIAARRAARRAEAKPVAFYARPNGSYYGVCDETGSGFWGTPNVWVPTWRDVTWLNQSTGASSSKWTWEHYSSTAIDPEDGTPGAYITEDSEDIDLVASYIRGEKPDVPILEVTGAGGSDSYQIYRNQNSTAELDGEVKTVYGWVASSLDPASMADMNYLGVSPKCFAKGDHSATGGFYNTTTYTGATGSTGAEDDRSGYWFGRNWAGWNAMGVFFEAPEYRYALRNVMVQYHNFKVLDEFDETEIPITARVYKVTHHNETGDEYIELGDLICEGSVLLNDQRDATTGELLTDGCLVIPMMSYDEESGVSYEEPADIDCDILVMVSGYDHDNIAEWSMSIASNGDDEGHGYIAYMIQLDENGEIATSATSGNPRIIELDNFFVNSVGNTAPTIYIDIEQPIMMYNWSNEEGEVEFPVEGGKITRTHTTEEGTTVEEGLSIFTNKQSSEFYNPVTSEGVDAEYDMDNDAYIVDGWLTVKFEDQYETDETSGKEEFNYNVLAKLEAAALPAGVEGREVTFFIHFPGGRVQVHATQGEVASGPVEDVNGDGEVNVGDVNDILATIIAEGYVEAQDVNGDGAVNVGDVNQVLAYILEHA